MGKKNLQTIYFLILWVIPQAIWGTTTTDDPQLTLSKDTPAVSAEQTSQAPTVATPVVADQCQISSQFSKVSYGELKSKLEVALQQKNKSSIFLELRTLQAQVDVLVNHLLSLDMSSKEDTLNLLEKNLTYLNQLETLLRKAKKIARNIKQDHVIPLATMTSLKADYDKCQGIESGYRTIFKALSQLNIDLTEILMISRQKIVNHKNTIISLIENIESRKAADLSIQSISSHLNFIQNQINAITTTFQFDTSSLNIAMADQKADNS